MRIYRKNLYVLIHRKLLEGRDCIFKKLKKMGKHSISVQVLEHLPSRRMAKNKEA